MGNHHTMDEPINTIRENYSNVAEEANGRIRQIGDTVNKTWHDVQDRSAKAVTQASSYAKSHPLPTAAVLFGFGVVVGWALRPTPPSFRQRYVDEPIEESRGAILGLLAALGALLKGSMNSASRTASDLVDDARDEVASRWRPVQKAAKRAGEKLGL